MKQAISNPPYNLKWEHPFFASAQPRFDLGLPPENNANFTFVLTALERCDYAQFILPNGVLTTSQADEAAIRKNLLEANLIEAVVALPDNMFVSTSIPTCVLIFNKKKTTARVSMIDLSEKAETEIREQRGQFGVQNARVYKKKFNVLPKNTADFVKEIIKEQQDIKNISKSVTIEEIRKQEYNLSPARYIEHASEEVQHRSFDDISKDLNRVIDFKNAIKITINENMAKSLGLYDLALAFKAGTEISKTLSEQMKPIGIDIKITSAMTLTKKKELKIEVKNFEHFPELMSLFVNMWKTQMMFLNNEENRLLVELRDALLPELLSGKITLD